MDKKKHTHTPAMIEVHLFFFLLTHLLACGGLNLNYAKKNSFFLQAMLKKSANPMIKPVALVTYQGIR